jgi:hypothetical protein
MFKASTAWTAWPDSDIDEDSDEEASEEWKREVVTKPIPQLQESIDIDLDDLERAFEALQKGSSEEDRARYCGLSLEEYRRQFSN